MSDTVYQARIAITGVGICSSIGNNVESVVQSLNEGRSGIEPYEGDGTEKMTSHWAALNRSFELGERFPVRLKQWWDRGTQMAAVAAVQATEQAGLLTSTVARNRIGLAVGVSGSGQFTPSRSNRISAETLNFELAELLIRRNVPHFQLYQIARWLEINGPMTCVCSASAGSGIAISNAMRWLISDRADAVVAGGGEGLMVLNFLGFDTLGLLSPNPCSPFSRSEGMSMGEGAAFVVMERWESAKRRGAEILGELGSVAVTNDAFDPILYDPSGDGIRRALQASIDEAGLDHTDIDWIRSSGAGTKEQDASEVIAIREVFSDSIPLVTSTEAHFGHCNGAGPAMGIVSALAMTQQERVPATLNFSEQPFAGIDFVPGDARDHATKNFLSVTAAFGGTNVVLSGSRVSQLRADLRTNSRDIDEVVVTGLAIVAPGMCSDFNDFDPSNDSQIPLQSPDASRVGVDGVELAGLIDRFPLRKIVPSINARGVDSLNQFAAAAAYKAIASATRNAGSIPKQRLGIVTGLARTSGSSLDKLMQELQGSWATPSVGRALINKGRFLVTSRLAHWFGCQGYSATHSGGIGCGQVALNQAVEQLRQSSSTDAILVVAADEVNPLHAQLLDQLGWLKKVGNSEGMIMSEGAVAVVVERKSSAIARGAPILARLGGTRCSLDAFSQKEAFEAHKDHGFEAQSHGKELLSAITHGLRFSNIPSNEIDLVLGCRYGFKQMDDREQGILDRLFGKEVSYASASNYFGLAHSTSPLQNLCLAIWAMQHNPTLDRLHPSILHADFATLRTQLENALLIATSEDGHNVVTFLHKA